MRRPSNFMRSTSVDSTCWQARQAVADYTIKWTRECSMMIFHTVRRLLRVTVLLQVECMRLNLDVLLYYKSVGLKSIPELQVGTHMQNLGG
jgi:hypothetical protein